MTITVTIENTTNLRVRDKAINIYTVDNGDPATKKLVNFRPLEFQDKQDVAVWAERIIVIEEVVLGDNQGK